MRGDQNRRQEAQRAASLYAPAPNGSVFTHAFVGLSIAVMLMFAISGFYGVNFLSLPVLAMGIALASGLAGVAINRVRTARNRLAVENEYQSLGVSPGSPATPPSLRNGPA